MSECASSTTGKSVGVAAAVAVAAAATELDGQK